MIDLTYRHGVKELMDRDDIPFEDMARTLHELEFINTRLGGHAITIAGLKALAGQKRSLLVCEIGCGGGDNLRMIYNWCSANGIEVKLLGIDINAECIRYASMKQKDLPAQWICSDYAMADLGTEKPDIIFSSLFCHHFSKGQLVTMMQWLAMNSATGFFINDLHRHRMAYYLIRYLTRIFSRSYLVKNDAAVSVSRGFKRADWHQIFSDAGISGFTIRWKWAFRWLVIQRHNHA